VSGATSSAPLGPGFTTSQVKCPVELRKWSARFHYHPNDLIDLFAQLGYACFKNNATQLARLEMMTDDTRETNFFFLHRETHIPKAQAAGLIVD